MLAKKNIQTRAEEILKIFDCTTLPIDVEKIMEGLDINLKLVSFDNRQITGVLVRKDGQNIIGVNQLHSIYRIRFSIAHSLGHFILHTAPIFIDERQKEKIASDNGDPNEIEANIFAAELLMPESFVHDDMRTFESLDEDKKFRELADKYQVSSESFALRLNNLGYELYL